MKSKFYWDLEQRSEDWHRLKWGKLSGSMLKSFMNEKKEIEETVNFFQLLAENQEDFDPASTEDGPYVPAMERGVVMEPFAIEAVEEKIGIEMRECGFVQKGFYLGCSPDRISGCGKIAIEVKCPGGKRHIQYIYDEENMPLDNLWQLVNYFVCMDDLEVLHFASYRPENNVQPLYLKSYTRESVINIGTTARPKLVEVKEVVKQVLDKYINLEELLNIKTGSVDLTKFLD